VAFHVEIRRGHRVARTFNLDAATLQEQVVGPWARGETVDLGDALWRPDESRLTVVEGPALEPPELSYGQGWNYATKAGSDVTVRVLTSGGRAGAPVADAVAVLAGDAGAVMAGFLAALGLRPVDGQALRAELLALAAVSAPPAVDGLAARAAVLVLPYPDELAVGLALGALGGRAILTRVGDAPPPAALAELPVLRLDAPGPAPLHALAQRLRAAGCDVRPSPGWDAPGRFTG
jgi:hypothetical protein